MAPRDPVKGYLTVEKRRLALRQWIRLAHKDALLEEKLCLSKGKEMSANSKFRCLSQFLDDEGLLRVGSRLKNTPFSQDRIYPILLAKRQRLKEMILLKDHLHGLHAGPQLMLATVRLQYWIAGRRDSVRQFVGKCITPYRHQHVPPKQRVVSLPTPRVNPGHPFQHCGVDYARPFVLKAMAGRSGRMYNGLHGCFRTLCDQRHSLKACHRGFYQGTRKSIHCSRYHVDRYLQWLQNKFCWR